MREKIYTIPVTDAFREECECPVCILEKKLEDEYIEYILGPSLMEPDGRAETNKNGFCRHHIQMLYSIQSTRHALALILDTHLSEQNAKLKKMYLSKSDALKRDSEISVVKNISNKISSKQTETDKFLDSLIEELTNLENGCAVCNKLNYTMDRYMDIVLYLWFKEDDFRALFNSKKGFCLRHFRLLAQSTKKYLSSKDAAIFLENLLKLQLENMERIQQEVNWFTKKFDYRNNDAPWGNSRDAVPRSIEKIVGHCSLK